MKNRASTWAALALSTLLVACSAEKPQDLLTSAKSYLDKGDARAAVIQIKNALQENPELPEGRYLLGAALLASGAASQAEVELRKALALGHERNLIAPKLATAMIAQGQARKVVEEFGAIELPSGSAQAELKTAMSAAHESLGQVPQAAAALAAALAADPSHVPARIADARRTAAGGNIDTAITKIEATLLADASSHDGWTLKGHLLLSSGKPDDALVAYRRALELRPNHLPALFRVASIERGLNRLPEAQAALDAAGKVAPNHPELRYQQAQLAILNKDYKLARESAQQLLRLAPDSARALEMAGLVELQLNSLVQAENLLRKSLQKDPSLITARKALMRVHMQSGNPAAAMEVLNAAAGKDGLPPTLYNAAGELHLLKGDAKKAEEFYQKALKLDPKDPKQRMSLIAARMAGGNVASGMEELKDIAADETATTADLALISTHLRRKEFDAALAAIDRLEAKDPGKPLAHFLRGRSFFLKGDLDLARRSFEAALKIDPKHFASISSLASMDIREQKPDAAQKRLEEAVAKDPKSARALMGLAEMAARRGAPATEVAALITRSIEASPTNASLRIALSEHHLRTNNAKEAVNVATKALVAFPDQPDLLFALGRAQLAARDVNQAIGSFSKLASMQPRSPRPLLAIAAAHLVEGKPELAAQSLRKALEVDPRSVEAQRGLIAVDVEAKRFPAALATARNIQKQRPKEPAGYVLEGDVFLAQKDLAGAEAAYRSGLKAAPSPDLASRLYAVLSENKPADAAKFATSWLREHPRDPTLLLKQGHEALARNDLSAAERHYLAVVKLDGNNLVALNNLSFVAGLLNRTDAASHVERALTLAPNEPAFMDTLAMLLSKSGDHAKALDLQTRALALSDSPVLRLNLAKILIKAGESDKAKLELERLRELGDRFPRQDEVNSLLATLRR